jgi:hypothetical protein
MKAPESDTDQLILALGDTSPDRSPRKAGLDAESL